MPTAVFMCDKCRKLHETSVSARKCEQSDIHRLEQLRSWGVSSEIEEKARKRQISQGGITCPFNLKCPHGNPFIPNEETMEWIFEQHAKAKNNE